VSDLPQAVADFLRQNHGGRFEDDVIHNLLTAPCAIHAFKRIAARLAPEPLILIAQEAAAVGSTWYPAARHGDVALRKTAKRIAAAAKELFDALGELQCIGPDVLMQHGAAIDALADLIGEPPGYMIPIEMIADVADPLPDEFAFHLAEIHALATAAQEEELTPDDPTYYEAAQSPHAKRDLPIPPFVAALDSRIVTFIDFGELPSDFELSHAEMAGLAWAATEQEDLSPIANTYESKAVGSVGRRIDPRTETVRKIRTVRAPKTSALRNKD
jgi:hypothetical protein